MLGKLFLLSLFLVVIHGYTIKVVNNVNRCNNPTYAYPSLKLFWRDNKQANLEKGKSRTFNSATDFHPNAPWLGIQENGMYCRIGGNPNKACINPDNAGMQVSYNGDCSKPKIDNPFYCNPNAPNAKDILSWKSSGKWPNCVLTLTRKSYARNCQTRC